MHTKPHTTEAKLQVAIVVGPGIPVPPYDGYGGIERGADQLASGLAREGHGVTLLAAGDSNPSHPDVTLLPISERSLRAQGALDPEAREAALQEAAATAASCLLTLAQEGAVDVVNLRWENPTLTRTLASYTGRYALQGIVSFSNSLPPFHMAPGIPSASELIIPASNLVYTAHTPSHKQHLGGDSHGKEIHVLPYGIDMSHVQIGIAPLLASTEIPSLPILHELRERGRDYLLFLGTITSSKSVLTAIQIAEQADMPLIVAGGKNHLPRHAAYFDQVSLKFDGRNIIPFGVANEQEKYELMRFASALVFCSGMENPSFSEPFGRVIAEAQASGTPVVGHRKGAFCDLVEEGRSGFGFTTVDEAVQKIDNLDTIDRMYCAELARRTMSLERFVQEFLRLANTMRQ